MMARINRSLPYYTKTVQQLLASIGEFWLVFFSWIDTQRCIINIVRLCLYVLSSKTAFL
jgi:hypothetical protein